MPLLNKSTSFPVKKFFLADTRGGPSPSSAEAQVSRDPDSSKNPQSQKRQVVFTSYGGRVQRIETQQRFAKWQEELRQKNQKELDRALQGKSDFGSFRTKLWHSIKSGIKESLASLKQAREINREVTEQLRNGTNLPEKIAAYQKARLEAIRQQAETGKQGVLTEEALFDIVTEENVQIIIQNCLRIAFETVATKISDNPENNNLNPDTIAQMIVNEMMENIGSLINTGSLIDIGSLIDKTSRIAKRVLKSIRKEGLVSNLQEVIAEFLKEKLGTNPTNADLGKILQEQLDSEKQSHKQGTSGLDEFLQSLEINFATEKRGVKGGHLGTTGNPWLDLVLSAGSDKKTIVTAAILGGTSALLRNSAKWLGWLNPFTAGGLGAVFGGIRGVQSAIAQQSTVFRKLAWRGEIDDPQSQGIASYEMISANNLLEEIKSLKESLKKFKDPNNTPNNNTTLFQKFEEINTTIRTILELWKEGKYALKNDLKQRQLLELNILASSQGSDNSAKSSEGIVYETLISVIQTEWFELQTQLAAIEKNRLEELHRDGTERVKNKIKELKGKIWKARWKNSGKIAFGWVKGAVYGYVAGAAGYVAGDFLSKRITDVWNFLQKTSTLPSTQRELTGAIVDSSPSPEGGVTQLPSQGTGIQQPGSGGSESLVTGGGGKSEAGISNHLRSLSSDGSDQDVQSLLGTGGNNISNTVEEPTPPTFEEILANSGFLEIPDGEWRSERLQVAGALGRMYAELMENNPEANLVKILSKPDGQLDPRRIVSLAEALTNANNSEGRLEILEKATRNPDEFFAGMEQWANKIGEAQQKDITLEFLIEANKNGANIPIPPELTKLYAASLAASRLNTPENSAIIANAIKTALKEANIGNQNFKIDEGLEWFPARDGAIRGLAQILHKNPEVGVLLSNDDGQIDPQKLAAMAEMLTRAYRQGQQGEQVEEAIEQVLKAIQQDPEGYVNREIQFSVTGKGRFGPISPEAQQEMLDVFNEELKNYSQEPTPAEPAEPTPAAPAEPTPAAPGTPPAQPTNLGLREEGWPEPEVLRGVYDYNPPSGTETTLPETVSEGIIRYREAITNDLPTLFGPSKKIRDYIPFDPTKLPDISQTEKTTVLSLDLSKTSMAEAIDGLNQIAGQTDKPIVLAIAPNGPNASIISLTDLGRQIGQYKNLQEALLQGRFVVAIAHVGSTGEIAIADPGNHINFDTVIEALGKLPERDLLYTRMPGGKADVEQNTGIFLELLGNIKTGDNSSSGIPVLSMENNEPRIRSVAEIFADSINRELTELAQNVGVNPESKVNIFTNGVEIDPDAVNEFLNLFSNPDSLKQLSDDDLTILVTLIAGSIPNRDLDEILKNNKNSAIPAIIQEFMNREGLNWGNISAGLGVVVGVVAIALGVKYYRSRRQAAGPGAGGVGVGVGAGVKEMIRRIRNRRQATGPRVPANAEIQRIRGEATNIINSFVGDLQSNNLNTQQLQDNWRTIEGELSALSQQAQGQGQAQVQRQSPGLNAINNLIGRIQHRVADSEITGNVDLTTELPELSRMVYDITNLLESGSGWQSGSHDNNIIAVFKAILFEAYNRGIDSQSQAIETGLTELETNLQNNQNNEIAPDMVGSNDVANINNLLLSGVVGLSQSERNLWNQLIQNSQQSSRDIIASLKNRNDIRIVRSIAAKIVVALESNRSWDSNYRQNNLKAVARVLAYMVQEIQKTLRDAPSTINSFVQDLRTNFQNNNPQELQRNWTIIQGALNTLSQQGLSKNLGLNAINNLIEKIQRRVADSEITTTNIDLTPELPELSRMVYNITNLLENQSGWVTGSHNNNIIAVFRAILYEAYRRERGSQIQAIEAGLTELETNGFTPKVTGNNHQLILSLISSSQNNNPPIVIDQTEKTELQKLQPSLTTPIPQGIIQTLNSNSNPDLRDTYRRVVARIVVELETNRNWNLDAHEGNLNIVAQVLAYIIANNQL
jgi:hypothetical protein